MTADAAKAPPTKSPEARALSAAAIKRVQRRKAEEELDLIRWTPEEVVKKQLLPYRSVRSLKEKCYRREVFCHMDGGRITFSPESIRRENARTMVVPIAA
ncbi:hypothetical protein AB0953_16780 [Streptomyces sp. NPDC046866]|uniref:hypothetical protein n=1 Tax=Streptomyces sp. NPDC046866 TaxID=3154921 RepID=UPI0034565F2F